MLPYIGQALRGHEKKCSCSTNDRCRGCPFWRVRGFRDLCFLPRALCGYDNGFGYGVLGLVVEFGCRFVDLVASALPVN